MDSEENFMFEIKVELNDLREQFKLFATIGKRHNINKKGTVFETFRP